MSEFILRIAKAIEGPLCPVPQECMFTLDELREHRWKNLTRQEQGQRMLQARAAIEAMRTLTPAMHEALVRLDMTALHDPLWPEYWSAAIDAALTPNEGSR